MKLRSIILLYTISFSTILFASCSNAQSPKDADATPHFKKITYTEWKDEAKTNIRLLPKYGNLHKTDEQKDADRELIETGGKPITLEFTNALKEKCNEN